MLLLFWTFLGWAGGLGLHLAFWCCHLVFNISFVFYVDYFRFLVFGSLITESRLFQEVFVHEDVCSHQYHHRSFAYTPGFLSLTNCPGTTEKEKSASPTSLETIEIAQSAHCTPLLGNLISLVTMEERWSTHLHCINQPHQYRSY